MNNSLHSDPGDQPVTEATLEANARFDRERHSVTMDPRTRLRTRNPQTFVMGLLTDKKIAKYESQGFYSDAFRKARREHWKKHSTKRDGNFLVNRDGSKVFSPL